MSSLLTVLTALFFLFPVAPTPDSPLVGTWTLDRSRSSLAGTTVSFSSLPDGKVRYDDRAGAHTDFALDGKEYPSQFNETVTATSQGPNRMTLAWKSKGQDEGTDEYSLSADGNTMTVDGKGTFADGESFTHKAVYTRIGGSGTTLMGKWKSTSVESNATDASTISMAPDGTLRWKVLHLKEAFEGKPDGHDVPISGADLPDGFSLAVTMSSPTELDYIVKVAGKVHERGSFTVDPDGKTARDTSWTEGKETEKIIAVYTRQ